MAGAAPAINEGFICPLYPKSPRHPRQKYLLTPKGLMLREQAAELVQGFGAVPVLCGLLPLTHGFETYIQDSIFSP